MKEYIHIGPKGEETKTFLLEQADLDKFNSLFGVTRSEWGQFKDDLMSMSRTQFNRTYTERGLVSISQKREKLPEFLKSRTGPKSEKVDWFQDNKNQIDNY